jgi:hypothetical protein
MDVKVMHGSTDITSHVISWTREHKICSGIGMLEITVDYTYSASFDPWDKITIFENGKKNGQYYVSSASQEQPNSVTVINAQDGSKKLSDYFISVAYNVDYPSYASFWIGYFLDEMKIKYKIVSPDPGTLLSNNTALGLMSGYEQIMYLLQLNGWYITFDYNDTAIIGKLTGSYGATAGSFDNRDILDIKTVKHDNMLRNRAVVWGKGDPKTRRWVFADVYKATKWDYDKKDRRTVVISNSNIRKTTDAFALANKMLLEFSVITFEKHVELEGGRNILVGDVVTIKNKLFTGKGKVTSFGTSLDASGHTTQIKLDERCPRLFAFWDLGGFVYVGTFGSGVWRKHIMPAWSGSPTGSGLIGFASGIYNASGWFDYSSGLYNDDLKVTDLHVSAGVLVCVTASGGSFYSLEDEHPWSGIPVSGLTVSMSGALIMKSGTMTPVDATVYSGVMARACIIDRMTNNIRIAVDTRSGENLGDFLMETDPFSGLSLFAYTNGSNFTSPSGFPSGYIFRSWVLDVSPYSGEILGSYPVGVSGNYDFWVYDIENDGVHDYVEAMTLGSGTYPESVFAGKYTESYNLLTFASTTDVSSTAREHFNGTIYNHLPYSGYFTPLTQDFNTHYGGGGLLSMTLMNKDIFYIDDYYPANSSHIAIVRGDGPSDIFLQVTRIKPNITTGTVTQTVYQYQLNDYAYQNADLLSIYRVNADMFRFVFRYGSAGPGGKKDYLSVDYNFILNTVKVNLIPDVFDDVKANGILVQGELFTSIIVREIPTPGEYGIEFLELTVDLLSGSSSLKKLMKLRGDIGGQIQWESQNTTLIVPIAEKEYNFLVYVSKRIALSDTLFTYKIYRLTKTRNSNLSMVEVLDHYSIHGPLSGGTGVTIGNPESVSVSYHSEGTYFAVSNFIEVTRASWSYRFIDYYVDGALSRSDIVPYLDYNDYSDDIAFPTHRVSKRDKGIVKTSTTVSGVQVNRFFNLEKDFLEASLTEIIPQSGINLIEHVGNDSINKENFFVAYSGTNIPANRFLVSLRDDGYEATRIRKIPTYIGTIGSVRGNFRITTQGIYWEMPELIPIVFPIYLVLQRDNYDYRVVKSGLYRDRLDISNFAPLVTMDRRISSTELYYISTDNNILQISNPSMSGSGAISSGNIFNLGFLAEDFRYASSDGINASGEMVESGIYSNLYVTMTGGISSINMSELSTVSGFFSTPSGYITRIETSNYSYPYQYMFVSVSGYVGPSGVIEIPFEDGEEELPGEIFDYGDNAFGFFQREPVSGMWVDYSSGYPQARTTIIRLDDSI